MNTWTGKGIILAILATPVYEVSKISFLPLGLTASICGTINIHVERQKNK